MNALLKSAKILDEKSDFNNKIQDILIADGRILKIGDTLKNPKKFQVIDFDNLHISQGWFDSSVCICCFIHFKKTIHNVKKKK